MSSETKYVWAQGNIHGAESITVKGMDYSENQNIGKKMVTLTQDGGSMSFHFSMTEAQARQMAMALIAAAESLA